MASIHVVGIAKAREEAKKLFAEASLRKNASMPITVEKLVTQFLKASEVRNKPRTTADYRRLSIAILFPNSASAASAICGPRDVSRLIGRLSKRLPKPTTRSRPSRPFSAMRSATTTSSTTRHLAFRFLASAARAIAFFRSMRLRQSGTAATELGYPFGHIVKLCLLTGQRRGEIVLMKWRHIDTKARLITFPAEWSKTTASTRFPMASDCGSSGRDRGGR